MAGLTSAPNQKDVRSSVDAQTIQPAVRGVIPSYLEQAAGVPTNVAGLAARWRIARIRILCAGAGGLAGNPNAPAKIRGAWGRALAQSASDKALEGGPCPWPTPCGYSLFFNEPGRLTARLAIPKPFVIALDREGSNLTITLSLFGVATDWVGEAADALVRALREGLDGRMGRRPIKVIEREIDRADGIPIADLSSGAMIAFHTPFVLRSDQTGHVDPVSLFTGLGNRLSGLARWHGFALSLDPTALKHDAVYAGASSEWIDPKAIAWTRGSVAQGKKNPMAGVIGVLLTPPLSSLLASLVSIGAYTHAGARTTMGQGRYSLHQPHLKP